MPNTVKILLVEDNVSDAMFIEEMVVGAGIENVDNVHYDLTHMDSCETAVDYLAENKADVILLDLSLPGTKGLDTVKKMVEMEKNTPIIVLTDLEDEAIALRALQNGVQDYLNKDKINSMLLFRAVKYAIERFNNLREKEELIKKLTEALEKVKTLSGLLPICSNCKNIRNDDGYWIQVESYLKDYSDLKFTHGICPNCAKMLYPEFYKDKNVR